MQRVPWRDRDQQRGDLLRPVRPGAPDLRILCLPTQALGRPPVRERGWEPTALCPPTASGPPRIGQLLVE